MEKDKEKDDGNTLASLLRLLVYTLIQIGVLASGIFTILAWTDAQDAKAQANAANIIAANANSLASSANLLSFVAICNQVSLRLMFPGMLRVTDRWP